MYVECCKFCFSIPTKQQSIETTTITTGTTAVCECVVTPCQLLHAVSGAKNIDMPSLENNLLPHPPDACMCM